ncbi:hypothetical protein Q6350_03610 [Isoptericola sp. b515]|uniref:hypothetical protein n=1 Tax=Isoptericola sp. b515 TaxID=3064652 RepID=UPI002713C835|nr:hypothetical protein [Isoptericola sp. b515]MDO8147510.1 hypothetical protein [Isoptericola sp. b515]
MTDPAVRLDASKMPQDDAALAVEAPVVRGRNVASVRRLRRGFRRHLVVVLDQHDGGHSCEIVWPDGRTEWIAEERLSEALFIVAPDRALRSHAGRLWSVIRKESVTRLSVEVQNVIRRRIDALLADQGQAVGVLLDRKALELTADECFSLPIDTWRVAYEIIHDKDDIAEWASVARIVVRDPAAPLGIRTRVAARFGFDASMLTEDVAALLSGADGAGSHRDRAASVAEEFRSSGWIEAGDQILQTLRDPRWPVRTSGAALMLALLDGRHQGVPTVTVPPQVPVSIIDELIDGRVAVVDGSALRGSVGPTGHDLRTYVMARTRPDELTTAQVRDLSFTHEIFRRAVVGEKGLGSDLSGTDKILFDAIEAVRAARTPEDLGGDPTLTALVDVLGRGEGAAAPDALLQDPTVWAVLVERGVLADRPTSTVGRKYTEYSSLRQARQALFEWDWGRARALALEGLRVAQREAIRDELLNILACVHWLNGEPDAALAALDKALEGEYTHGLLTNAAVVASGVERQQAIDRFVRLAHDATSGRQRAMAAERALVLWQDADERAWEGGTEELPSEIVGALRSLIAEDLPDERYVRLLRTLAVHDDEWFSARSVDDFGVHRDRSAVRVFRARAAGLDEYINQIADEFRRGHAEPWLELDRDQLVGSLVDFMMDHSEEPAAAYFGMSILEAGVPLAAEQRIPLVCLTIRSVTQRIDPDEGEPNTKFIAWLRGARDQLHEVDDDRRESFAMIVAMAGDGLGAAHAAFRHRQFDEVSGMVEQILERVRRTPSHRVDFAVVARLLRPAREFVVDTQTLLDEVRPLVSDSDLRDYIEAIVGDARSLNRKIGRLV